MLARTWKGTTRAEDADAYLEYLARTGLGEYGRTLGNRGAVALRRVGGAEAEFLILSLWDSPDAIRRFAGERPDRAVFYPEDRRFLLRGDSSAEHFEVVFATATAGPLAEAMRHGALAPASPVRAAVAAPAPTSSRIGRLLAAWWSGWLRGGLPDSAEPLRAARAAAERTAPARRVAEPSSTRNGAPVGRRQRQEAAERARAFPARLR